MYRGDFLLGNALDFKFTTVNTSGVPTTLAGSPAIEVYLDNSLVQLTGIGTLTVDFDGKTGMHHVNLVLSGGNGFAVGKSYQVVLSAGTVGGNSVVGYVIAEFSIQNRYLASLVTAGGRIKASLEAILDTAFTEGAAGRIANAFKTFFNIAAPTLTTADVNQTGDAYALVNDGTIGLSALSSRIPAALVSGRMSSYLGATAAAVIDSGALATSATASIADAIWNRNPKGGADGVAGTSRAGDAQAGGFFKFGISVGGTLTVFHADGVTTAATASIARYAAAVNAMQQGS